jgi:hypothetical protein
MCSVTTAFSVFDIGGRPCDAQGGQRPHCPLSDDDEDDGDPDCGGGCDDDEFIPSGATPNPNFVADPEGDVNEDSGDELVAASVLQVNGWFA